jgi:hypothetical protein
MQLQTLVCMHWPLCCRRLAYLSTPTVLVAACVVGGLLEALTPLSIITGAIMLFQAMHHTKVTTHVCAQPWCRVCSLDGVQENTVQSMHPSASSLVGHHVSKDAPDSSAMA